MNQVHKEAFVLQTADILEHALTQISALSSSNPVQTLVFACVQVYNP